MVRWWHLLQQGHDISQRIFGVQASRTRFQGWYDAWWRHEMDFLTKLTCIFVAGTPTALDGNSWAMKKCYILFRVYRGLYYTAIWGLWYSIKRIPIKQPVYLKVRGFSSWLSRFRICTINRVFFFDFQFGWETWTFLLRSWNGGVWVVDKWHITTPKFLSLEWSWLLGPFQTKDMICPRSDRGAYIFNGDSQPKLSFATLVDPKYSSLLGGSSQ